MDTRPIAVALLLASTSACLGFNTEDGHPNNIVAAEGLAYASIAGEGIAVIDPASGAIVTKVPVVAETSRVDDVAAVDGLLFALDASDGFLTAWSLADPREPLLVSGPIEVPVGPFAGVAAADGVVVVSGGTSELTVRAYDDDGTLAEAHGRLDLDRGQPDVLLSPDGEVAYVSTHFSDDVDDAEFGITTLRIDDPTQSPTVAGRVGIDGAGFTGGTANPANFPIETALDDDELFVAHGGGLAIVDVTDPTQLRIVGRIDLSVEATSVDVDGTTAFVVGIEPTPQLVVVDAEDPTAPTVIQTVDLAEGAVPTGVVVDGDDVLVAANGEGVIRLDR